MIPSQETCCHVRTQRFRWESRVGPNAAQRQRLFGVHGQIERFARFLLPLNGLRKEYQR